MSHVQVPGFIAGAYSVTWNSLALGQLELDSLSMTFTGEQEDIQGDNLGASIQDGVFRGGNCYFDMTLLEYDTARLTGAFWPHSTVDLTNLTDFGATSATVTTSVLSANKIGSLMTSMAKPLVLTKLSGPNATPASITVPTAVLPRGYPISTLFAPRSRRIPLRMIALPFTSIGSDPKSIYWFLCA